MSPELAPGWRSDVLCQPGSIQSHALMSLNQIGCTLLFLLPSSNHTQAQPNSQARPMARMRSGMRASICAEFHHDRPAEKPFLPAWARSIRLLPRNKLNAPPFCSRASAGRSLSERSRGHLRARQQVLPSPVVPSVPARAKTAPGSTHGRIRDN
jgi:hypothetical protein